MAPTLAEKFQSYKVSKVIQKEVTMYYLEEDTLNWWSSIERHYGNVQPMWEQFHREFERNYFPIEARDRLEIQFLEVEQGTKSVWDYEA